MITSSPQVVSLLLDRKANVEHRAKTGLTPLMEAASGGYTEVGEVTLVGLNKQIYYHCNNTIS